MWAALISRWCGGWFAQFAAILFRTWSYFVIQMCISVWLLLLLFFHSAKFPHNSRGKKSSLICAFDHIDEYEFQIYWYYEYAWVYKHANVTGRIPYSSVVVAAGNKQQQQPMELWFFSGSLWNMIGASKHSSWHNTHRARKTEITRRNIRRERYD